MSEMIVEIGILICPFRDWVFKLQSIQPYFVPSPTSHQIRQLLTSARASAMRSKSRFKPRG